MKRRVKKKFYRICNRIFLTVILILLQVGWLAVSIFRLTEYSAAISAAFALISALMVLYVISKDLNPEFKIGWIILILLLPVFGGLFYFCFGDKKPSKFLRKKMKSFHDEFRKDIVIDEIALEEFRRQNNRAAMTSDYIRNTSDYPVYQNYCTEYFELGEVMFQRMCEELEQAKHFIFLEYFIMNEGTMWDTILEILVRKAEQGVEVRIMYDDIGCVALLPPGYQDFIENMGSNIQCVAFNPLVPFLSFVMNNRDHRKIMVIDGHTAFNGGINLSDEYINIGSQYGHWKDTGVMVKGPAVWNFTVMFLEAWRAYKQDDTDINNYRPHLEELPDYDRTDGFVQPFCDTPLEDEPVAENAYIALINQALDYVYIFTPYMVIDNEMKTALCLAAKRGVDVRIVTPGIADKKIVNRLTKSNYPPLLKSGVRIYEYTPGFIHAKSYVCDDKFGVVGTINMDFRSLYLHFECGTFLYNTQAIQKLKQDCLDTFEVSREIYLTDTRQGYFGNLFDSLLRMIAPLL